MAAGLDALWEWQRGKPLALGFGEPVVVNEGGSFGRRVATTTFTVSRGGSFGTPWPHIEVQVGADVDGRRYQDAFSTRRACAQACVPHAQRLARDLIAGGGPAPLFEEHLPGREWRRSAFQVVQVTEGWRRHIRIAFHVSVGEEDPDPDISARDRIELGKFLKAAAEHLHSAVHADVYAAYFRDR
jgi:hypothetical protein